MASTQQQVEIDAQFFGSQRWTAVRCDGLARKESRAQSFAGERSQYVAKQPESRRCRDSCSVDYLFHHPGCLLEAVGRCDKAVLLKRGPAATVDEMLLAAEYILDGGNRQVMLCERGIRTFESHTRFTLPLATVPWLQARTHLPVVVDPSHGTGHADLVPSMAAAAVAAGADGLIIEVHPDPQNAASDGGQTLDFIAFEKTMATCRKVAEAIGRQLQ
ncbi:MAG: hypothetical protein HOB45_12540 [Planctomycetaceae bacterium]|nr:hypothetical protein [Planctomycetaceae bacterium]